MHLRNAVAAALLARSDDHLLPVRAPVLGTLAFRPRDRARGEDRLDFGHAELDRLAHRAVHLLAGRHALYQRDAERRLALDGAMLQQVDRYFQPLNRGYARRELAAAAVEQGDVFALAQPQDVDGVMRRVLRERAHASGAQRRIDVEARGHARIFA